MMFCINCGKKIVEGAKFCMACGARVVTEVPEKHDTPPIEPQNIPEEKPELPKAQEAPAEIIKETAVEKEPEPYDAEARSYGRGGAIAAFVFGVIAFLGLFVNLGVIISVVEEMF